MITGLRGLAQSFVRAAVVIGRAIDKTYTALTDLGLGYVKTQFELDFAAYDAMPDTLVRIADLDKDYLIPGGMHIGSPVTLSTKFKYDVATDWETMKGEIIPQRTSISSNQRLTQNEIEEAAATQMVDYTPEGGVFHGPMELEGSWFKD